MARAKPTRPADPQAIAAERVRRRSESAEVKHQARMRGLRQIATAEAGRDARGLGQEGRWEADLSVLADKQLAAGRGVERRTAKDGARQKVMSAERADPFTNLWRAGGVDTPQFSASQRFLREVMVANGVRDGDAFRVTPVDAGANALGELVTEAMVTASRLLAKALKLVGIRDRRLLEAFAHASLKGEQPPWRDVVREVTGVTERHRQGQVIEDVLENLRLAQDQVDRDEAAARREKAKAANDPR